MLEALHLQGMEDVYDGGINYKVLSSKISSIGTKYSVDLRSVLERMLINNVEERISFEEIESIVENNTFDDESMSLESQKSQSVKSKSSRRPLDSIPSNTNLHNSRKEEIKPSKAPSVKKDSNNNLNSLNSSILPNAKPDETYRSFIQNYDPIIPPVTAFRKFEPLQPFTYNPPAVQPAPIPNYNSNYISNSSYNPSYYSNYSSYQFTNPLHVPSPLNLHTQTSYVATPTSNRSFELPKTDFQPKSSIPVFQTPVAPISTYSQFAPVNPVPIN